ncbi:MAG: glycosyltransferase [Kiritimatiellia bacterium]
MITNTSSTSRFDNRGKRIGIFVIAYNAESHICETLLRIPEAVWNSVAVIYIIDDCSTDDTVAEALALAKDKGKIVVLRNRINQRYGGNQKLGYQYALDEKLDIVVMLHADGQYAPECLESLLAPLIAGEADVVLGSRMIKNGEALKGNMPRYKYCGNIILTRIQNSVCGTAFSEYHSGFRAYSTSLLRRLPLWENTDEWHFDTQILLQATRCGARIVEVPIPTYYGNEICHVNGISYALHCVLTSIAFYLHRHGVFYSRKYDLTAHGSPYHDKFDDPYSSHSLILRWLTIAGIKGKQVLDVGVGDASLARMVNKEGGVVDGIEIDRASAELARLHCRNVTEVDLDNLN